MPRLQGADSRATGVLDRGPETKVVVEWAEAHPVAPIHGLDGVSQLLA